MTFIYRVQVTLNDGDIRTWYEDGNSAETIRGRVARALYNCKVENAKIEVRLGS